MSKARRKNLREPVHIDDYWMGMAFMAAGSSRNPGRQQGAVIVGPQGNLLALGCDSPPKCMYEGDFLRPAEKAVIQDSRLVIFGGATIYMTHSPSPESTLDIVAADIKRIVYARTKPLDPATVEIGQQAYVQLVEFRGSIGWIRDHINSLNAMGVFS